MRSLLKTAGRPGTRPSQRTGVTRRALVAAAAVFALVAAGCGGSDTTDAAGSEVASNSPRLDSSVFEGEAMTIGGESFDLAGLADKDLVVWFWAPW